MRCKRENTFSLVEMKLALFIVTAMLAFSKFAEAQVIFEEDFSGPTFANWIRGTRGDLGGTFINTFSVGSTLQDNSGNPYREYDIAITQAPPDDNVTWYGGANFHVGGITVLPSEWELSFEVFMDTVEPIRIQFLVVENSFPFPPKSSLTLTAWVSPSQTGWDTITLDSSSFVAEYQFGVPPIEGTSLIISMTSHDASSNPLSIASVGDYSFSLDSISLTTVPEPSTVGMLAVGLAVVSGARWRRK